MTDTTHIKLIVDGEFDASTCHACGQNATNTLKLRYEKTSHPLCSECLMAIHRLVAERFAWSLPPAPEGS